MSNLAITMPFSKLMGAKTTDANADAVIGELTVRAELCTTGHFIMHGAAIMAFPEGGEGTTTIESSTKFLGTATENSTVTGTAKPIKIGKRLSVWRTAIETMEGKLVALVTQTQIVF